MIDRYMDGLTQVSIQDIHFYEWIGGGKSNIIDKAMDGLKKINIYDRQDNGCVATGEADMIDRPMGGLTQVTQILLLGLVCITTDSTRCDR